MKHLTFANATLAYLVLVLVIGGASAAGHGANLALQLLGTGLIGWSLSRRPPLKTGLRWFGLAFALLVVVQFLPLPPGLWTALPGRPAIAQGFALAGAPLPWLTISLAPWNSLASLVWWIPALALFLAARAPGAPPARDLVRTVVGVAIVSVLLAALQQTAGSGYIYRITNYGLGTGFFANSNHQGSFLVACVALLGGYAALDQRGVRSRGAAREIGPIAVGLLLIVGVLASGSLACIALLLPTVVASVFIARPELRLTRARMAGLAAGAVALALMVFFGPFANDLTEAGVLPGMGRREYLITGMRPLADFAPFGSGLGTFVDIYRRYEDHGLVGTTFVNHAHNDLLELLIETGVLGLVAVAAFVAWFAVRAWREWSGKRGNPMALAASLVIGVELLHSLVDYPLRTAAMSSLVALACVLLARPAEAVRQAGSRRHANEPERKRELVRI